MNQYLERNFQVRVKKLSAKDIKEKAIRLYDNSIVSLPAQAKVPSSAFYPLSATETLFLKRRVLLGRFNLALNIIIVRDSMRLSLRLKLKFIVMLRQKLKSRWKLKSILRLRLTLKLKLKLRSRLRLKLTLKLRLIWVEI